MCRVKVPETGLTGSTTNSKKQGGVREPADRFKQDHKVNNNKEMYKIIRMKNVFMIQQKLTDIQTRSNVSKCLC